MEKLARRPRQASTKYAYSAYPYTNISSLTIIKRGNKNVVAGILYESIIYPLTMTWIYLLIVNFAPWYDFVNRNYDIYCRYKHYCDELIKIIGLDVIIKKIPMGNQKLQENGYKWKHSLKKELRRRIGFLGWVSTYSKMDAVSDLIAGITIGLTMVPQSMAYATLARLPPKIGLNSAFAGGFIYVLFGTIKQVSIGPTSLMALLTLQFISQIPQEFMYQYLCLLTFLCGCVELLMGLMRLGFLVDVISTPVISGFTSASAVIIIIAQIKHILGISYKSDSTKEEIVKLFENYHKLRYGDTALGVSCIILLLVLRKFKDFSFGGKVAKKSFWFISVSRNAIIVVLCCLLSYGISANGVDIPFKLTNAVEPGLPHFQPPPFELVQGNRTITFMEMVQQLRYGFAVIPIIAVLINVSIAKAFTTGGRIDANQEMLTLSLCNILASFFHSMPICGAFTRSAVSNTSGVRTPFANFYSALITIFALTFLTPSFRYIPKTTLAAILIAAVIFLIDTQILTPLWKCCKRDLIILVTTFLICLYYGVEVGLLIGVLANLIHLIYLWARPSITSDKCKNEYGEYLVITPDLGLFYPGVDNLYQFLVKTASRNRHKLPVAVDCCYFKGVDYTAIRGLSMIADHYLARNQKLVFYNVREDFLQTYKYSGYDNLLICSVGENLYECLFNEVMDFRRSITCPVIDTELQNIKLPANNTNTNAIHEAEKLIKTVETI